MKNLKLLLVMGAMAAAMPFIAAPAASATTLTGSGGTMLATGTTITAEAESKLILHPMPGDLECGKSEIAGKTSNTGGSTETVSLPLETFTESSCNWPTFVLKKGTLEFHTKPGSTNGTVTWSGTEVTAEINGFHCIFTTSGTDIGTLTSSATTGGNATLDIEGEISRTAGRSGVLCGSKAKWTGSYKFTTPSTLNVQAEPPKLTGEVPTVTVNELKAVTWKNTGGNSAVINDETNSDSTVVETTGFACGTIVGGGSCTVRLVKCLKKGEATLTARDTTEGVEGSVTVKCDEPSLTGEAPTATVGETVTVTWKNNGGSSLAVNDETVSDETVVETTGTACGTIAAGGSCTSRKIKCLKAGEATVTARATASSAEGKFTIKCDNSVLTGEAPTPIIGETVTVTWKNDSESALTIEDESTSNAEVAKTVGTGCGTIPATSSCTTRKIECLKEGEATIIARDTPEVEGKFTIKCDKPPVLTGEAPTGHVGETITATWKNTGGVSAVVNSETSSDETIAKTVGSACGTIAAEGSCTTRKIECLKEGEATITAQVTSTSVKGEFKVKCDAPNLTGEATGVVGEALTVTWKNAGESSLTINDETSSDETIAKTLGSACGTIAGTGSCTNRKIECLKKGEATLTARDTTAGVKGEFVVKCDSQLEGSPTTANVNETVTVTWTNNTGSSVTIEDESTSDGTVAETLGSSCGTIVSKGSCTSRKIKCLKKGESTITAVDTPSIEGKFVIKCD